MSTILMLTVTTITALLISEYAAHLFKEDKRKTNIFFISITLPTTIALIYFFGLAATTIKGILFSLILTFASFEDVKTRQCDDYLHLMIVIAAFIGTEITLIPNMLMSAVFIGALILTTMVITHGKIGGADIKMVAACSFLLGIKRGIIGLLIGTVISVLFNIYKDKNKGFPMIPYLAIGYMTAYFI